MPQAATPASPTLPDGIEIFRPGRLIDDAGNVHVFTAADIEGIAKRYDPAVREAPLTVGHPEHNLPAYGWVKSVGVSADGRLVANPHQVEANFAEMVAAGRFKKRSSSFYPPHAPNNPTPGHWYLRHVAFLGAQPPAVAGLKDIQFSEDDAGGAVSFSEPVTAQPSPQEPDDMDKELQDKLAKAEADLAAANEAKARAEAEAAQAKKNAEAADQKAASFAEAARADRKAGFVSFAEAQVQAGHLLPKNQAMCVAALEVLADAQPVEFSEGDTTTKVSPAQWLQNLISSGPQVVSFGEFGGQAMRTVTGAKGKSDAEIDKAAQDYARQNKVSYADALTAVTTFTS
jgi:hypothetical protein